MLSNLSKLADRSFIVGFFVPAVIVYVLGGLFVVRPLFPGFYDAFVDKSVGDVVLNALAVWVLAIVLMIANDPLFKIVEGYRWPISRIGWLQRASEDRFKRLKSEYEALNEQWLREEDRFPEELRERYDEVQRILFTRFPSEIRLILPTRFGNAIRAFEDYSRTVYGADSIPLWLHLSTIFSKEFREEADDARTVVNCLVNIFVLLVLLACALLAVFFLSFDYSLRIYAVMPFLQSGSYAPLLLAAVALGAAWLVYELSIDRVIGWGAVVKAGFDCYLPELAEKLGYDLSKDVSLQKDFWIAVSRRAIYKRALDLDRFEKLIATDDDD